MDSPSDIWAVGWYKTGSYTQAPLILRWDGSTWRRTETGAPGIGSLFGVSALASSNVWAVGSSPDSLTLHWDGSTWTRFPSPNPGVHGTVLSGVVAVSSTDVWAVGTAVDSNYNNYAIAMHWDGRRWSLIPVPGGLASELFGVDGRLSTDVWAVGEQRSGETFVLHWDGQSWVEVPAPEPELSETLYAVSVISSTDAWAAGIANSAIQTDPFTIHWDGSSWSEMPSVGCTGGCTLLNVRAPRPDDAWVVGVGLSATPLAAHWDGLNWTTVRGGPSPGELSAVAPSGPASAWAVGQQGQCDGPGMRRPGPITAEAATSGIFRPACSAVLRRLHL